MKPLVLILALLIAALPLQARACAMTGGEGAGPVASAAVEGGADSHDCCPGEAAPDSDSAPQDPCSGGDHCSQCAVPVSVVPMPWAPLAFERPPTRFAPLSAHAAPSHDRPPYRPPIS